MLWWDREWYKMVSTEGLPYNVYCWNSEGSCERIKNEDKRKIYQKLSQHLAYKGFGYDTIKSVLNKILNFDEYEY